MKNSSVFLGIILLIVGGFIGAGIVYYNGICKTSATSVRLNGSPTGPGITITKTGDDR